MIKSQSLKPMKAGYEDNFVAFYPRMISVAEQDEVNQKIANVSDNDDLKYKKLHEIRLEAIAEWSESIPQIIGKEKGVPTYQPIIEDAESTFDAMKRYFGELTNENERVILNTYNAYCAVMEPKVLFL